jgi:hypothetical protein
MVQKGKEYFAAEIACTTERLIRDNGLDSRSLMELLS